MRTSIRIVTSIAASCSLLAVLGGGCATNKQAQQATQIQQQLRQPAPAAAPTSQPQIPPEAARVPKPY